MASLSATLTEFSEQANSKTYTTSGHTASKPKLVIEKRTVPVGNQVMADFSVSIIQAVNGADSVVHPQKVSYELKVRYPIDADPTDLSSVQDAALVLLKDFAASDEFGASHKTQNWVF